MAQSKTMTMRPVTKHEQTLLSQIEHEAMDGSASLSDALRKCVVLGGKSGSEQLRDWATHELKGYYGEDELPSYRIVAAPLLVDGIAGNYQVTRQPFPTSELPDFIREQVKESVELRDGVGALE